MRTFVSVTEQELVLERADIEPAWLGVEEAFQRLLDRKLRQLGPFARRADNSRWRHFDDTWRLAVDVPDDPIGLLLP